MINENVLKEKSIQSTILEHCFCCYVQSVVAWSHGGRGIATYASNVSFGHPEHYFLTVCTPKSLGQDLLMMTIPRR